MTWNPNPLPGTGIRIPPGFPKAPYPNAGWSRISSIIVPVVCRRRVCGIGGGVIYGRRRINNRRGKQEPQPQPEQKCPSVPMPRLRRLDYQEKHHHCQYNNENLFHFSYLPSFALPASSNFLSLSYLEAPSNFSGYSNLYNEGSS